MDSMLLPFSDLISCHQCCHNFHGKIIINIQKTIKTPKHTNIMAHLLIAIISYGFD